MNHVYTSSGPRITPIPIYRIGPLMPDRLEVVSKLWCSAASHSWSRSALTGDVRGGPNRMRAHFHVVDQIL
jgi:hypothetical protein